LTLDVIGEVTVTSCGRVISREVVGEPLAHLLGGKAIVGEIVAVLAARPWPVVG
jgi:hypothetical protein